MSWLIGMPCHWTNQKAFEERGPMKTRSFRIDKRRRSYLRLISEIKHALAQALAEEHAERGLTMAEMARTLEVDRSHISRKLSGDTNMTLETLADLAYALDRPV